MAHDIDQVRLALSPGGATLLNVILALITFGVALEIRPGDFRGILERPRAALVGIVSQLLLLPALTLLLVRLLEPGPSIALGMIIVAACPGGNVSNFITHLARGNTALSVTLTASISALAVLLTPFNIAFWGALDPGARGLLRAVDLSTGELLLTIICILGVPLVLGMLTRMRWPDAAARIARPAKAASVLALLAFVAVAAGQNREHLSAFGVLIFLTVAAHNGLALLAGYAAARLFGLAPSDVRAVTIEVGIQNSGLALALILTFFEGLGGMALIAAAWGIWHIVAGMTLAAWWGSRPLRSEPRPKKERSYAPVVST